MLRWSNDDYQTRWIVLSVALIFLVLINAIIAYNLRAVSESIDVASKVSLSGSEETQKEIQEVKYWEIVDTGRGNTKTGVRIDDQTSGGTFLKYEDYLIGVEKEFYVDRSKGAFLAPIQVYNLHTKVIGVRFYNIDTGESVVVTFEEPLEGEAWYQAMQTVDNRLYFGFGGAFGPVLSYRVDLPPSNISKIETLDNPLGNSIERYGDYFLSTTCYEGCSYSLIDANTDEILRPLERITDANNAYISEERTEQFIGVDSQGRAIIQVRNLEGDQAKRDFDTQRIVSFPIYDESRNDVVLTSDSLPENNLSFYMIDGTDKILAWGESAYLNDLNTKVIKKIEVSNEVIDEIDGIRTRDWRISNLSNSLICYSGEDRDVLFDFNTEKFSYTDERTEKFSPDYESCNSLKSDITREFTGLNLGENFVLEESKEIYETYVVRLPDLSLSPTNVNSRRKLPE